MIDVRGRRLQRKIARIFSGVVDLAMLVTGGAGYIGSHMVLALVDKGENVVVLDDLSTSIRHAVRPKAQFISLIR